VDIEHDRILDDVRRGIERRSRGFDRLEDPRLVRQLEQPDRGETASARCENSATSPKNNSQTEPVSMSTPSASSSRTFGNPPASTPFARSHALSMCNSSDW